MIVAVFVGRVRKGPIKTTSDGLTGKGLPDFCAASVQIDSGEDCLDVGIELQNQPERTLCFE